MAEAEVKNKVQVAEESEPVYTFRPLWGRLQGACKVTPLPGISGRLETGQGFMTEEQKSQCPFVVTKYTTVTIKDGTRLDLNDPVDKIKWGFIKRHPYIALSKEEGLSREGAQYYIENRERDSQLSVKLSSAKVMAQYKILNECSLDQQVQLAKLLGLIIPTGHTSSTLSEFLLKKVEEPVFANLVLDTLNPKNKEKTEARIFVKELIAFRIIESIPRGYKYDNSFWQREDEIVDFVLNKDNFDTTSVLRVLLEDIKKK